MEIRVMADGGGDTAVFSLKVPPPAYDPGSATPFVPAAPAQVTVKGVFEKLPEVGTVTLVKAKFMFACSAEIPGMEAEDAKVLIHGITYLAKQVRLRRYMGRIDGYSMDLEVGPGGQ